MNRFRYIVMFRFYSLAKRQTILRVAAVSTNVSNAVIHRACNVSHGADATAPKSSRCPVRAIRR